MHCVLADTTLEANGHILSLLNAENPGAGGGERGTS